MATAPCHKMPGVSNRAGGLLTPSTENLRAGKGRKWEYSKKEKGQWDRTVAPSAWLCQR